MISKRRGWRMASAGQSRVRGCPEEGGLNAENGKLINGFCEARHRAALMILRIAATGPRTNCASVSLRGCSPRLDDTEFIGGDDGKRTV